MAKMKQRIDINQASLFDILKNYQEENHTSRPAGSFDIDLQFRELISQALKKLSVIALAGCGTYVGTYRPRNYKSHAG